MCVYACMCCACGAYVVWSTSNYFLYKHNFDTSIMLQSSEHILKVNMYCICITHVCVTECVQ